jgi:type IV pilus assembly protein PilA
MRKHIQKGFTLIELMIVVAIIGILAAIAIPAYQDYTIRAQVTEGLTLASAVKAGVAESYANTGAWPADLTAAGGNTLAPPAGKYVTSVLVTNGTITILYGGQANNNIVGATLGLQPGLSANNDVEWACGRHAAPATFAQPAVASGLASAATNAAMLDKYLPSNCRT